MRTLYLTPCQSTQKLKDLLHASTDIKLETNKKSLVDLKLVTSPYLSNAGTPPRDYYLYWDIEPKKFRSLLLTISNRKKVDIRERALGTLQTYDITKDLPFTINQVETNLDTVLDLKQRRLAILNTEHTNRQFLALSKVAQALGCSLYLPDQAIDEQNAFLRVTLRQCLATLQLNPPTRVTYSLLLETLYSLSCGVPIITTKNHPMLNELVIQGSAIIIESLYLDRLSDAVSTVIDDYEGYTERALLHATEYLTESFTKELIL